MSGGNSNGKDGGSVQGVRLDLNYIFNKVANETRPVNKAVRWLIRAK